MYLEDFPAGTNICVSVEDTGKASFGRLCTLTVSQDHKKYLNQNRATRTNKNARILKKQGSLFGLFKKNKFKETSVFLCEQSEWLTLAEEKSFPGSFAIGKYKWKHSSPSAYSSHSMWTPPVPAGLGLCWHTQPKHLGGCNEDLIYPHHLQAAEKNFLKRHQRKDVHSEILCRAGSWRSWFLVPHDYLCLYLLR